MQFRLKPLNGPPPPHGSVSCLYRSGKVKGTFNANGGPVVVGFTEIKFTLAANSGEECSRTGTPHVTVSFALSSEGEPATATVGP